jgi:hypothetical protein
MVAVSITGWSHTAGSIFPDSKFSVNTGLLCARRLKPRSAAKPARQVTQVVEIRKIMRGSLEEAGLGSHPTKDGL